MSVDELLQLVPSFDSRRNMLIGDDLASVDGLCTMVYIAYKQFFGVCMRTRCPDCRPGKESVPCQDFIGGNAQVEGGIFGRMDAGTMYKSNGTHYFWVT